MQPRGVDNVIANKAMHEDLSFTKWDSINLGRVRTANAEMVSAKLKWFLQILTLGFSA